MKPLANMEGATAPVLNALEIDSYIVEDNETLFKNLEYSLSLNLPTIFLAPPHEGTWVICAGGPTLKHELKQIKKHKKKGHDIISVNGSHDFLIKNGIIPDYMIMVDPKASNQKFVKTPHPDVNYLIGGFCDPSIFDSLKGMNLRVWFPIQGINEENKYQVPMWVGGGSTVGLRSISLGIVLGYRKVHLYGFSGCLEGEKHHAYDQPENDGKEVIDVWFQGKEYACNIWMAKQADDYIEFLRLNGHHADITVHSEGLIKNINDYFYKHIGE